MDQNSPSQQDPIPHDETKEDSSVSIPNQEVLSKCFICEESTEEDNKLKTLQKTLSTVKNAAANRSKLTTDKYEQITRKILNSNVEGELYHPNCYRQYTAVKRPREDKAQEPESKSPRIETRTSSYLPKTDKLGILEGKCVFCGKTRKKKKGKEESLIAIATKEGCDTLMQRAHISKNNHFRSLILCGVDLIAKEGKYHGSCRVKFMHETETYAKNDATPHNLHKKAYLSVCSLVQMEVIKNGKVLLMSSLLKLYKVEYSGNGGDPKEVVTYSSQNLSRKFQSTFGEEVRIALAGIRQGNYICKASLTDEQAIAKLHDDAKEYEENEKIRYAALHLRSQIMKMPKSKTPDPATVQNLKDTAPEIPQQLDLFFRTLLGGLTPTNQDTLERKVTSMASDAIFNVSHGTVKPWKHTAMGLGLASLTGSKLSLQILNKAGHSISYNETKGLETEFAYSISSEGRDAPGGIHLLPNRATASVWDNNDANIETVDGKGTLHSTVGHTYQNVLPEDKICAASTAIEYRKEKKRKSFVGNQQEIVPFRKPLKSANFIGTTTSTSSSADIRTKEKPNLQMKQLDLYWFWELRKGKTPLYAGYMSQYVSDPLPIQRICYMDPIPKSPTDNAVVRETMTRTLNVAKETGQDWAVVTYDLAVALKAYSIQAIEQPRFDKLLIMLGNFHIELAFYGGIGTMINESGIEFILTESEVLAEGSMMGFLKGKFYNRCIRIHELLANVLEIKLHDRFLQDLPQEEYEAFQDIMDAIPREHSEVEAHLTDPIITQHLQKYEEFFHSVMEGSLGQTAQFWAIYIFLINRVHREVKRCVKMNDVDGYINAFPAMLDVFFALNRPNYARWGTLFLQKLVSADPQLRKILADGAFSIRRTTKQYSRSAVDISLEQTVNRDASSSLRGIVAFRKSESAIRRWSLTMSERAMAMTELRTFAGLEVGESATAQCHPSRIKKDNGQMQGLGQTIEEFCNPFGNNAPTSLVNLATGRAATKVTEQYLLQTMKRGQTEREKFREEWNKDSTRFLRPLKRLRVNNFAAEIENKKKKKTQGLHNVISSAESLRDTFIRIIIVLSENTSFDLRHVIKYPITLYPLSLAHADGAHLKTAKSTLLNKLEDFQTDVLTDLPMDCARVYDGGLLIHSVLSLVNVGATFGSIARTVLSTVCSGSGSEVHVCLDKYVENSIKDSERQLRGTVHTIYTISGPDQSVRQKGQTLLSSSSFKNELGKFLLREWKKDHYWSLLNGKTLYASHGGVCYKYTPNENQHILVSSPAHLQANHEEADTLIAFHLENITSNAVLIRASDTDVLVILIGILGRKTLEKRNRSTVIMDCGRDNSRRYINVNNIVNVLEERKPGLSRALPGYHAFTGCDFTSSFYR